jgi:hypothetical protein
MISGMCENNLLSAGTIAMKRVVFNQKGGVGKSTIVFNLAGGTGGGADLYLITASFQLHRSREIM